jgi:hypothetical protein
MMAQLRVIDLRLAAVVGLSLTISLAGLAGCIGDPIALDRDATDAPGGPDAIDAIDTTDPRDSSTPPSDAADGSTDPEECTPAQCSGNGQCATEFDAVDLSVFCEDTFINSHEPSQNYANDPRITVYTTPADTVSNRILFTCDLSHIPAEATIDEAVLRLNMYALLPDEGDEDYQVSVHGITDVDPVISEVTWSSFDGSSPWPGGANGGANNMGDAVAEIEVPISTGYQAWTVTDLIEQWVQDPAANRGMILDGDDSAALNSNRNFRSLEYSDTQERPRLLVSYSVPAEHAHCACDDGWAGPACDRCAQGYTRDNDRCVSDACTPTSRDSFSCAEGDVYWFDSCGQREDLKEDCGGEGCDGDECTSSFAWVEGFDKSAPTLGEPEPDLGDSFTDEHYGTTVTRVTDTSQPASNTPNWIRHEYSRRQAYNADSSYVLMFSSNGWWRLYSLPDWTYERDLPSDILEPTWHPTDPDIYYHFAKDQDRLTIHAYDVEADSTELWIDLEDRLQSIWTTAHAASTGGEGEPSMDGRYWSLIIEDDNGKGLGLITLDTEVNIDDPDPSERGQIQGTLDLDQHDYELPDHISTSPLGTYAVVGWNGGPGERAYTLDFEDYKQIHSTGSHADLGFDASGNEVWVGSDHERGFLRMVDLDTGDSTDLINIWKDGTATAEHISLNAFSQPGWAVVSFYQCNNGGQRCAPDDVWYYDKVALIELHDDPRILNVAHTHRGEYDYWSEPHASANRDLTRIVFASSWEGPLGQLSAYEVTIPPGAIPDARQP